MGTGRKANSQKGRNLASIGLVVAGLGFALAVVSILAPSTSRTVFGDDHTIRICHATGSHGNPYVNNQPAKDGTVGGHDEHDGPIWFPGITETWGDIIPPFEFDGGSYPGKNWTAEGQAIWENNCNIPATPTATPTGTPVTPTVTPTPTGTPVDTATPTPTGTPATPTATPTATETPVTFVDPTFTPVIQVIPTQAVVVPTATPFQQVAPAVVTATPTRVPVAQVLPLTGEGSSGPGNTLLILGLVMGLAGAAMVTAGHFARRAA